MSEAGLLGRVHLDLGLERVAKVDVRVILERLGEFREIELDIAVGARLQHGLDHLLVLMLLAPCQHGVDGDLVAAQGFFGPRVLHGLVDFVLRTERDLVNRCWCVLLFLVGLCRGGGVQRFGGGYLIRKFLGGGGRGGEEEAEDADAADDDDGEEFFFSKDSISRVQQRLPLCPRLSSGSVQGLFYDAL